jgi:LacI family transcriptional regulator
MSVTQKEIAEYVGISRSVVAFALNDSGRVAPETRQRVKDAARELGYDPHANVAARSLVAKRHARPAKTGVLAVMTRNLNYGNINKGSALRDQPFYADLLDGIESEAGDKECDVFICAPRNDKLPRFVVDRMVDGIILFDLDTLALVKDVRLPILLVSMPASGVDFLAPAEQDGMYKATRHLIELGHRDIIFLGLNDSPAVRNRAVGYQMALEERGLLHRVHACDGSPEAGAAKMEELLKIRQQYDGKKLTTGGDPTTCFTAVVCRNDLIAMGAVTKIQEYGLRVPQSISVVGFDDVTAQYSFSPLITSVKFDRCAMGRRAVEFLCEAELSNAFPDGTKGNTYGGQLFETELVIRNSTAKPSKALSRK